MSDEPREKSVAVQPYRVTAECPYCYNELEFTGEVLTSHPPRYVHVCPGEFDYEHEVDGQPRHFNLWDKFPRIDYREL